MSPLAHPIPAEWLTAYHDGELDLARRDQLEAHLTACDECRRELEGLNALSQMLASDELAQAALSGSVGFWHSVESQLPDRRPAQPAGAPVNARSVLLRWLPGIGLLLLNGAVQVAAVLGTAFVLLTSSLSQAPAWAPLIDRLATDATLGWLAWLWPVSWSGLGLFLFWLMVSAALAVLYLAWLGYELRYGASARYVRAIAGRGD